MSNRKFLTKLQDAILFAVTIMLLLVPKLVYAAQGPLKASNAHPIIRLFLNPVLETPEVLDRGSALGSASFDYGSVCIVSASDKWDINMDMEFTILTLSLKMGLPWQAEGAISFPFLYYQRGFLDPFVNWFHSRLGVSDIGRERSPTNDYSYRIRKHGNTWFRPGNKESVGPGDGVISLKKCLFDNSDNVLSIKGALKAPTGDPELGLGSGEFDAGIMLLFEHGFDTWRFYLGVGYEWLGTPDTYDDFDPDISDTKSASFALEYIWSDNLSLLTQVEARSSPFTDTDISNLDRDFFGISFGGKYRLSNTTGIEFAFSEDLSEAAADFTVHVGIVFSF